MQIGQKLQEARHARGLTQEAAAELVGVSRQTISNWERGKSLPDVLCSLDTLLKGDPQMQDKIKHDTDVTSRLKAMTYAAYAAIAAGACVALFGPDADSLASPALQFTIAAAPWVFMALGIGLYAAARGATHEDETPDGSASDAEGSKR